MGLSLRLTAGVLIVDLDIGIAGVIIYCCVYANVDNSSF